MLLELVLALALAAEDGAGDVAVAVDAAEAKERAHAASGPEARKEKLLPQSQRSACIEDETMADRSIFNRGQAYQGWMGKPRARAKGS